MEKLLIFFVWALIGLCILRFQVWYCRTIDNFVKFAVGRGPQSDPYPKEHYRIIIAISIVLAMVNGPFLLWSLLYLPDRSEITSCQ